MAIGDLPNVFPFLDPITSFIVILIGFLFLLAFYQYKRQYRKCKDTKYISETFWEHLGEVERVVIAALMGLILYVVFIQLIFVPLTIAFNTQSAEFVQYYQTRDVGVYSLNLTSTMNGGSVVTSFAGNEITRYFLFFVFAPLVLLLIVRRKYGKFSIRPEKDFALSLLFIILPAATLTVAYDIFLMSTSANYKGALLQNILYGGDPHAVSQTIIILGYVVMIDVIALSCKWPRHDTKLQMPLIYFITWSAFCTILLFGPQIIEIWQSPNIQLTGNSVNMYWINVTGTLFSGGQSTSASHYSNFTEVVTFKTFGLPFILLPKTYTPTTSLLNNGFVPQDVMPVACQPLRACRNLDLNLTKYYVPLYLVGDNYTVNVIFYGSIDPIDNINEVSKTIVPLMLRCNGNASACNVTFSITSNSTLPIRYRYNLTLTRNYSINNKSASFTVNNNAYIGCFSEPKALDCSGYGPGYNRFDLNYSKKNFSIITGELSPGATMSVRFNMTKQS